MNRTSLIVGVAPFLVACAASADRWTEPDQVLFSDADTIRIQWRPWQLSEQVVRGQALLHCNGRPIQEVEAQSFRHGLLRTKTWKCVGI
jgi:hypothetical protein